MVDKLFICPQRKQEKIPDNEMIYCDSCSVIATSNCCSNKMKIEFAVRNSEKQELLDLKASVDVFKNGFNEAIEIY